MSIEAPIAAADLLLQSQLADAGLAPDVFQPVLDLQNPDHQTLAADSIKNYSADLIDKLMLAEKGGGAKGAYDPSLSYKHDSTGQTVAEHFRSMYGRVPNNLGELATHFADTRDDFTGYKADAPAARRQPETPTTNPKKDSFLKDASGEVRRMNSSQAAQLQKLLDERKKK